MKLVLDANVIIAAFASRGLCESIFELCLSEHEIVLCDDLLDEIVGNLRSKIKVPVRIIAEIKELLLEHATLVQPAPLSPGVCRDPADDKVLGTAVEARADYIVTGDKDLLVLKQYQGIPIITPRAFSDVVHKKGRKSV